MTTATPIVVEQVDREAAAELHLVMSFGPMQSRRHVAKDYRDGIHDMAVETQAFARHRHAERERTQAATVTFLAKAAHAIAWQAGVGGRETAGAIVSYLATAPDEIAPFFADKLSPIDFAGDWMRGGCLSWHGSDGKVWTPEQVAAAIWEKTDAE